MINFNLVKHIQIIEFIRHYLSKVAIVALIVFLMIAVCLPDNLKAQTDFTEFDLEELMTMNIEVTSVAKKPQKLFDATAAVFLITQEDIRRSGVTSIPEALRMVPGLQVARIDVNKWAITSRGFNGRFANKLLVLIDGHSIYTPLYSGVFWEMRDILLEDVDRIEVIRGPGATLWGANAVNGVINIITKQAKDSQGSLVAIGAGTEERGFGGVRYGGKLGEETHYRAYAKYFNRDNAVDASGEEMADDWKVTRAGFRIDWQASDQKQAASLFFCNSLTLQGDIYDGYAGETVTTATLSPPYTEIYDERLNIAGGNVLLRGKRAFSESSDATIQIYYDRTEWGTDTSEDRDIFDFDFQHRFALGEQQEFVWGLGYRLTRDDFTSSFTISLNPDSRDDHLFSAFMQDDISLFKDRLRLTVGSKFEHNDYTGFEIQPNARLLWTLYERHSVWTSVSRAVRTPSRAEHDMWINRQVIPPNTPGINPSLLPAVVSIRGNRDFDSEELIACELGYRVLPVDRLSVDVAGFYNDYDNLRTLEPGTPFPEGSPPATYLVVPFFTFNKMRGKTYGIELVANWQVLDRWRLQAAYAYLQMQLRLDKDSYDTMSMSENAEDESPHHQLSLRSSMDLPKDLELDLCVRYVDNLPNLDIESYITIDAHLGWKPYKKLELSIVGQNLLDSHHPEFTPEFIDSSPTEVERSVYGKIILRF